MPDSITGLPGLGQTVLTGEGRTLSATMLAQVEGLQREFVDRDPTTGLLRSNSVKTCILVRNVSGIALLPGYVVSWKSGYRRKQVDGYTRTTAQQGAGVVDEHLPAAGVANNDLFWLTIKGPTNMKTDLAGADNNVIGVGNTLVALTAVTSQATTAGRVVVWGLTATSTGTTDGTLTNHLKNYFGYAMSAKTTANTNANVLADVDFTR